MRFGILILGFICLTTACNRGTMETEVGQQPSKEQMIRLNKDIVEEESTSIRLLVKRYGWNMQTTESGLYYEIFEKKSGTPIRKGDLVKLKYVIKLLDGSIVYNYKEDGIKEVTVEKSEEPIGLHEALKLMKRGEKANLIIPAHLAYGSLGDGNKIPGFSTLIYTIEIQ